MQLQEFNLRSIDSGAITLETPRLLAKRVMATLRQQESGGVRLTRREDYLYRAITNIAVASALDPSPTEADWLRDLVAFLEFGYAQSLRPELANQVLPYLSFQGRTVAFMPQVTGAHNIEKVFDGISDISVDEPHTNHWIIDCSEVKCVTADLIGQFVGLKYTVAQYGAKISFLWLPRTALPKEFESILKRHFSLAKKGVFLISLDEQLHHG